MNWFIFLTSLVSTALDIHFYILFQLSSMELITFRSTMISSVRNNEEKICWEFWWILKTSSISIVFNSRTIYFWKLFISNSSRQALVRLDNSENVINYTKEIFSHKSRQIHHHDDPKWITHPNILSMFQTKFWTNVIKMENFCRIF